jgi:NitT/TauT family transport system substrate-binding protein
MKKLILESTAPFQGLPELVAYHEGLFTEQGIEVSFIDRDAGNELRTEADVNRPDGLDPFASHGKLFEQGKADMYNACEWGNYCRVQDTDVGSRQIGRRGILVYAALVVAPDSKVYTPQQLAGALVGVPYYFGTHYLALHMLEGFLTRDLIRTCRASNLSGRRLDSLMAGEIDATTLTEPFITLAEKKGCRIVCLAPYHGTEVAAEKVDADTYAAFNRAVKQAVRRIDADKRKYLQYFIDYYSATNAEIAALSVDDLRESRLQVVDPAPIPDAELQRTFAWLRSWDMLGETMVANELVNMETQEAAHQAV